MIIRADFEGFELHVQGPDAFLFEGRVDPYEEKLWAPLDRSKLQALRDMFDTALNISAEELADDVA